MLSSGVSPARPAKTWWADVLGDLPLPQQQYTETTLDIFAKHGHFAVKENPRSPRDRYGLLCPFHTDRHPSISVHEDKIRWKCWVCGIGGGPTTLRELLGDSSLSLIPRSPKPYQKPKTAKGLDEPLPGCTLKQLAEARNLSIDHLRNLGWYDIEYAYRLNGVWTSCPAIAIPYPNGGLRYRVGLEGKQRFRWKSGTSPDLYGRDRIKATDKVRVWVEGESNTSAGLLLGFSTVGVPGASNWKSEWARYGEGCVNYLWQDPDQGGETLRDAMLQDIPDLRVIEAPLGVKDVCELLSQAGAGAGEWLRELMDEAEPYHQTLDVPISGLRDKGFSKSTNRDKSPRDFYQRRAISRFPYGDLYGHTVKKAFAARRGPERISIVDWIKPSWHAPLNAQKQRRALSVNVLPKMEISFRQMYLRRQTEGAESHEAITKRIERAIASRGDELSGWFGIDNRGLRGFYAYFTNVDGLEGFEPVADIVEEFHDALDGIALAPPGSRRYRPFTGSRNWRNRADMFNDGDKGEWEFIATQAGPPIDEVALEAEWRARGAVVAEVGTKYWDNHQPDGSRVTVVYIDRQEGLDALVHCGMKPVRRRLDVPVDTEKVGAKKRSEQ